MINETEAFTFLLGSNEGTKNMLNNLKTRYSIVIPMLLLLLTAQGFAKAWQDIKTVQDLWPDYGPRIETLLNNLDLTRPGLEQVKATFEEGKIYAAGVQLLAYYNTCESGSWLRLEPKTSGTGTNAYAEAMLQDTITIQGVTAKVPRLADGGLDWTWYGPDNNGDWALLFTRLPIISSLYSAYRSTGNIKYLTKMDENLRDFLIHSLPYTGWTNNANVIWRGLEIAMRINVFSKVFYGLINNEELLPATRLLILCTLNEHGQYLKDYHGQGNWLTIELGNLTLLGAAWPEFKQSTPWIDYSLATLKADLSKQVYPDGVQTELTSHYHWVALTMFEQTVDVCKQANREISSDFTDVIEKMWNYLAYSMRPDGYGLLNNDGDKVYNRDQIVSASTKYVRPDWTYIASNGESGEKPEGEPSVYFKWAGQLLMRNGWDKNAHWGFFDKGPWGSAHQHNDHLHMSIAAFGRDLLVDAGRFAYDGPIGIKYGPYARSSMSHNVILIDGKGQAPNQTMATVANENYKIGPMLDYSSGEIGSFEGLTGTASHRRSVMYVRDKYWVVMDRVNSDRARTIQVLWHFHPDCNVIVDGKSVSSNDTDKGNLRIVPVGNVNWSVQIVKGQDAPSIQGWYSHTYNDVQKNATAVYTATVNPGTHFGWLLVPGYGPVANPVIDVKELGSNLKMNVSYNGIHTQVETAINTLPTEEAGNLALLRPASYSSVHSDPYAENKANDGDVSTFWASGLSSENDENPWYQVDLGRDYIIERVEIVERPTNDVPEFRTNFEIWGAKNADFTEHTVMGVQTGTDYTHGTTWSVDIAEEQVSRYIRLQRINDAGRIAFAEIRVYGKPRYDKNLAILKPVTYSSVHSAPYAGMKANDDNLATEWASPSGTADLNPWYQVDLGHDYIIDYVEVVARQNADQPSGRTNFEIWGARDDDFVMYDVLGAKTDSAYPHKGTWGASVEGETVSRYIRFQRTNAAGHVGFSELRVYGKPKYDKNLAEKKPVSASSIWSATWYSAPKGNDGNISTDWVSAPTENDSVPWYQVDLGKEYSVGRVELVARQTSNSSASRTNFAIWVSNDSTFGDYTVLASKSDSAFPHQGTWSVPVLVKNAGRYIRVQRINVAGTMTFAELRVYGEEPIIVGNREPITKILFLYDMYLDATGSYLRFNGLSHNTVIDIYNIRGDKLISSNEPILDVSRLSKGAYIVNIPGRVFKPRKFVKVE
ncbi:MAG: discoidin domain-containing protein [Fibrobacteria bacterium]|nr:discoidin domain-containing protein [Fibrobacteria bacterium]